MRAAASSAMAAICASVSLEQVENHRHAGHRAAGGQGAAVADERFADEVHRDAADKVPVDVKADGKRAIGHQA